MTRRVTIPDDHVALILPGQLADELMELMKITRQLRSRVQKVDEELDPQRRVAGDVMLALLEAKEA